MASARATLEIAAVLAAATSTGVTACSSSPLSEALWAEQAVSNKRQPTAANVCIFTAGTLLSHYPDWRARHDNATIRHHTLPALVRLSSPHPPLRAPLPRPLHTVAESTADFHAPDSPKNAAIRFAKRRSAPPGRPKAA